MAANHILFNDQSSYGGLLRRGLQSLESGLDFLEDVKGAMQMMIDGDGSAAAHFGEVRDRFGFTSDAKAKEAWEELNSLIFKLTTNNSVTDVGNAIVQAFNKFR